MGQCRLPRGSVMLKVSVIIPVYNGEQFIARAIESVLLQTYPVHEVIVVNDGSQDRTAEVLSGYGDRIHTISIPNGGVSHARNVGISACTGEIVAFLDADDVWDANKTEVHAAVFRIHPEVGFCCCDYLVFNNYLNQEVNHFSSFSDWDNLELDQPSQQTAFALLLKENLVGTCSTVAIRKSVLNRVGGFDEGLRQAEDYDLWLRCALLTEFVFLSDILVTKVTHENNLTGNIIEMCLCHEQVLIATYQNCMNHIKGHQLQHLYATALAAKRYQIGNAYYEVGSVGQAFRYYGKGLRSSWSVSNLLLFAGCIARKTVRLLSGGLIAKSRFRTDL